MGKYYVDIEISGEIEAENKEEAKEQFLEGLDFQIFIGNAIITVQSEEERNKILEEIRG
jgi:hypothetical protein